MVPRKTEYAAAPSGHIAHAAHESERACSSGSASSKASAISCACPHCYAKRCRRAKTSAPASAATTSPISSSSFQNPGGIKSHILNLHHEFEKRNISSKIIVPKRSHSESGAKYSKNVLLVGTAFPISFNASQADLSLYFNLLSLGKILRRERFDILHFHNLPFPSILEILSFSNATHILTLHFNPDGSDLLKNLPWFPAMVTKILNWKIQGVIAVSQIAMEIAKGYRGPKRIIPNGVNTDLFGPGPFKQEPDTILFVGRLEERKGLLFLLRAFLVLQKKHPKIRLLVLGEGKERETCERFIRRYAVKNA